MRFGGALLTGVVFAFGTFFVVWLAWPLTSVYAFIPWTLALTELVVRRPGRLPVAGLAAVVGLQFLGGHPESSFHLMFTAAVFFVFRAVVVAAPARQAGAAGAGRWSATWWRWLRGAGLAALVLAPFLEFVLHSGDLSPRPNAAAGYWPRKYLGALFLHDYWGRPTQVDLESFMQVRGWYAGAVTLMLAAAALLVRRSGERSAVAVSAVFCACMVVGHPAGVRPGQRAAGLQRRPQRAPADLRPALPGAAGRLGAGRPHARCACAAAQPPRRARRRRRHLLRPDRVAAGRRDAWACTSWAPG